MKLCWCNFFYKYHVWVAMISNLMTREHLSAQETDFLPRGEFMSKDKSLQRWIRIWEQHTSITGHNVGHIKNTFDTNEKVYTTPRIGLSVCWFFRDKISATSLNVIIIRVQCSHKVQWYHQLHTLQPSGWISSSSAYIAVISSDYFKRVRTVLKLFYD